MALITFTSDFGDKDFYVPAVKAKILSVNPQLTVVDITHNIPNYDVAHAAFVLKAVYKDFPQGTIHLVAMNGTSHVTEGFIAIKLEGHIFLGPNNGVLSLLSELEPEEKFIFDKTQIAESTFPAKDIIAPIAAQIASGAELKAFGEPITQFKRMVPRHIKATKKQILGYVTRVDNYGNLITNIPKDVFDTLNPGTFNIEFSREKLSSLHRTYDNVEPGDCFAFFNSLGLLEIGVNLGHGADLLGLRYDSPVFVNFEIE